MNTTRKQNSGVEPRWNTYIHARGAALGLPIAGNFEITSGCNFNCKMCYVHENHAEGGLSAQEWIDLGRKARDCGMIFLLITGGEPFLRKDFREIYSGLKELGLLISINTNGSLITDEWIEFLAKDPPLRMNISLYGAGNETYKNLCGQAAFDTVADAIRRLHDAGIQIRINSSVTPYNAADISKLYRFAEEIGVPLKATTYMFPPVRVNGCQYGDAPHRFTAEEAAAYMLLCREQYMTPQQLAYSCQDEPFGYEEDCSDGQGERMRCRAGKSAFWVTWDGRMLPCGMFSTKGFRISEMGFEKAWEAVRRYSSQFFMPAECKSCSYKSQCPACAASCMGETGETSIRPDYICRMTETLNRMTAEKYSKWRSSDGDK